MALNSAAGLAGMLKAGHKHMEGVEGATLRNIEAAKGLATIVSSSLGPNGMNKLVINHLEKIIVTSDCATIVRELEIQHPAAKMLELAAEMQEQECGDGTNLCVSFAGELLKNCEDLLRMGLHTSEIVAGYKAAAEHMHKVLPELMTDEVTDFRNEAELVRVCKPVLAAKQFGYEDFLAPLVAKACMQTFHPDAKRPGVNQDSVRIAKIMGGNIKQSEVINGMVIMRGTEGAIQHADQAKISVFACGVEASATEAKGTVLMKDASDLMNYNKSEEKKMDEIIKSIADTGTKVVISGGTVSEMAMHFIERYGMMCIKVPSKWELKRICSATGSTAMVRLGPATADELGFCDEVNVKEIGGRKVVVFSQTDNAKDGCRVATILLRASTESVLNDLERAIDDGVNCVRTLCSDGRLVPGAGATEMELSQRIKDFGDTCPGLDQYAIRAFAKALQFVPKTLAQNSGQEPTDVIAALGAAHAKGRADAGVDIAGELNRNGGVMDCGSAIMDLLYTKESALRLSIDAAITVLRVDQIIMSKPAQAGKMGV